MTKKTDGGNAPIFAGLKLLELGDSFAAATCGKMFAGFGASVCRLRRSPDGVAMTPQEHAWFNTAKLELGAGVSDDALRARIEALFDAADVVLDGWGIDALSDLGFSADVVATRWPYLILCQVTPFGQTGPHRAFAADDLTLYAMSGLMNSTGAPTRAPLNAGWKLASVNAGLNAFVACGMALLRRERDGRGDIIDLSIQETALDSYEVALTEYLFHGKNARRNGDEHGLVPWRTYPCKDGEATIVGGPMRHWAAASAMFDDARVSEPPYNLIGGRIQHRREFEALIRPWLLERTRAELLEVGQGHRLAWGYVASIQEAFAFSQFNARGFFVDQEAPGLGPVRMPGALFRSGNFVWQDRPAPAQTTDELPPAWSDSPRPRATPTGATRKAPLAGIKVLDFTHDWAGPHATRVLADFGADVIKIEFPKRLDISRGGHKHLIDEHARFWHLHRGKRSLTLDLKNPAHLQLCEKLIADADVVIENSRPGVMAELGLSPERLRRINPRLVHMALSGFGADGPLAHYGGYGAGLESLSGMQWLTGYAEGEPHYRVREADVLNGVVPAGAVCAALWQREITGLGQHIDFSEAEGCAWYVGEQFLRASLEGRDPSVVGNRSTHHAPQGCYRCAGQDRWLVLSVHDDVQWQRLAMEIGETARDAAFDTLAGRQAAHDRIDELLTDWLSAQPADAAMHRLQALGIAAGCVFDPASLAADPHLAERRWFLERGSEGRFPGTPFSFRADGFIWRARGPRLGEYNAEIFAALAPGTPLPDLSADSIGTAYE
ncbi:MAG: CoA transferase [Panacagrimonas sp.]